MGQDTIDRATQEHLESLGLQVDDTRHRIRLILCETKTGRPYVIASYELLEGDIKLKGILRPTGIENITIPYADPNYFDKLTEVLKRWQP